MSEVTLILERAQAGDPNAAKELLPLVYDELRALARCKMAGEAPGQTLQPVSEKQAVVSRAERPK